MRLDNYFKIAQASYNPRLNAVKEKRVASFRLLGNAEVYVKTNQHKALCLWANGQEIMWTDAHRNEYRKIID